MQPLGCIDKEGWLWRRLHRGSHRREIVEQRKCRDHAVLKKIFLKMSKCVPGKRHDDEAAEFCGPMTTR
jgi:hypothetical protein